MTYIATDRRGGDPVELITFSSGGQSWRYTSSANDVTFNLLDYLARPIQVPPLTSGNRLNKSGITIRATKNLEVLSEFRSIPGRVIDVRIQEYHANDPDLEVITRWSGEINNVQKDETEAKIFCIPTAQAANRSGVNRNYQAGCPYVLYGTKCAISSANFRFSTTVIGQSGVDITLAGMAQPDGYYSGGYIEWNNGAFMERRTVLTHTGSIVGIDFEFNGALGNAAVNIYPGCNHTVDHCINKFSNYDNYGGQPYYSDDGKNPMNGDNVF